MTAGMEKDAMARGFVWQIGGLVVLQRPSLVHGTPRDMRAGLEPHAGKPATESACKQDSWEAPKFPSQISVPMIA